MKKIFIEAGGQLIFFTTTRFIMSICIMFSLFGYAVYQTIFIEGKNATSIVEPFSFLVLVCMMLWAGWAGDQRKKQLAHRS